MKCKVVNQEGNFDNWELSKLEELKKEEINDSLGQKLLFEDHKIRKWEAVLHPKERLPFRRINASYSCVALTNGLAISRYSNGVISLIYFEKNAPQYVELLDEQIICDIENIGEDVIVLNFIEYKSTIDESRVYSMS